MYLLFAKPVPGFDDLNWYEFDPQAHDDETPWYQYLPPRVSCFDISNEEGG